jgi:hypothetical protein
MNLNPTMLRDLPPRRRAERKEHLLAEISTGPSSATFPAWGRRSVVVAVAAIAAVTVGASAVAYRYLGPSPGFTAGISAFEELPRAEWPSSQGRIALERSAPVVGLTPAEAEERLRLLQTGLTLGPGRSEGEGSLYAYPGRNGTACIFLTGQGGSCVTPQAVEFVPSAQGMVFPGYPGQTDAAVGLVADNVRSVVVIAGDARWPVEIVNNSFYTDLPGITPEQAVSMEVRYADDSTRAITLRPGTGQSP